MAWSRGGAGHTAKGDGDWAAALENNNETRAAPKRLQTASENLRGRCHAERKGAREDGAATRTRARKAAPAAAAHGPTKYPQTEQNKTIN